MNIWARYKGILYDASLKSDSEVIGQCTIKFAKWGRKKPLKNPECWLPH